MLCSSKRTGYKPLRSSVSLRLWAMISSRIFIRFLVFQEQFEFLQRLAGDQRFARANDRIFQSPLLVRTVQRHGGVRYHRVVLGPGAFSFTYTQKEARRRLNRVATMQIRRGVQFKSQIGRVGNLFAAVVEIFVWPCQRNFVISVEGMENDVFFARLLVQVAKLSRQLQVEHPDKLARAKSRGDHGTQPIEEGLHAQFTPNRRNVCHSRVKERRVQKANVGAIESASERVGVVGKLVAEVFQQI